jgi:hypothetical protein
MFLNPLMLLGISAVSVPILIHLLNRRKFERVRWAAMRFLRASIEQNQRRLRVEDLLLLLIRCAMVVLLAMALARPAIRSASLGWFGQAGVTGIILLDASGSMSQTDGVQDRFARAKTAAEQVLDSLPSGSSVAVWLVSDGVRQLIPEPTFDLAFARQVIRDAARSDRGSDLFPAVRLAVEALGRAQSVRRELYLITDGQRIGWKQLDDVVSTLNGVRSDIQSHLVLIDQSESENLALTDLRQATGIAAIERPLRFVADVTNFGTTEATDVRVALRVRAPSADPADADAPVDEALIESIPPGATRSVSLFGRLREEGYHAVAASLAPDRVPADDRRSIVVRGIRRVRVLLIDGEPGVEPRESETYFLRNALVPVARNEQEQHFVSADVIDVASLGGTALDDYDSVVVANVADFSSAMLDALSGYVARGGGLIVFPGGNTQASFYNEKLTRERRLLPAELGEPVGVIDADKSLTTLGDRDLEHPIAGLWKDPASGSITSVQYFRLFPLKPLPAPSGAVNGVVVGEPRVVFRYADNSPAVVEHAYGQGRVILFGSTADASWNLLPVKPAVFVPLLYRCLGAIVQRQDESVNIRTGQKFLFRTPGEWLGRDATIELPSEGKSEPPRPQTTRVELAETHPQLAFDDTDLAGVYRVAIPEAPPLRFAAAGRAEESTLESLSEEQVQQLASVATVTRFGKSEPIAATLEKARVGTELWLPLVVALIALAVVESLLADRFSRPK